MIGALALISMMANFALLGAGNQPPGSEAGIWCVGFIGLAFVFCGYQTVNGTAKDTLGNGVGSIILGSLYLVLAVAVGAFGLLGNNAAGQQPAAEEVIVMVVAAGAFGLVLVLAGEWPWPDAAHIASGER